MFLADCLTLCNNLPKQNIFVTKCNLFNASQKKMHMIVDVLSRCGSHSKQQCTSFCTQQRQSCWSTLGSESKFTATKKHQININFCADTNPVMFFKLIALLLHALMLRCMFSHTQIQAKTVPENGNKKEISLARFSVQMFQTDKKSYGHKDCLKSQNDTFEENLSHNVTTFLPLTL